MPDEAFAAERRTLAALRARHLRALADRDPTFTLLRRALERERALHSLIRRARRTHTPPMAPDDDEAHAVCT